VKTAISIPDLLYESIEEFIATAGISRSEFFQRAARLYLKKVSARVVAENLGHVYGEPEDPGDVAFRRAALSHLRDLLQDEKW
jgi:hypothetical protein